MRSADYFGNHARGDFFNLMKKPLLPNLPSSLRSRVRGSLTRMLREISSDIVTYTCNTLNRVCHTASGH